MVKNLGKVDRSKNDNPILSKVKNKEFIEGLNEVKFEVLEFSNVPCACCGNMTITHNEKKVIENEIKNAKNLKELSDISHKYYKLIRQNYRPVINKFQRIVSERPKISDEDMLKCLKSYCNEEINNTLKRSVERFSNPDVLIKYNSRSRECLKEYVNKTKENFH